MSTLGTTLAALDDDARQRVMDWAASRFGLASTGRRKGKVEAADDDDDADPGDNGGEDTPTFNSISELYDAADPKDGPERTLVVGYWFQIIQGEADFSSHKVNNELKHLGHGITNVTGAFTALSEQKPALVMQVKKSGKTQQARKQYRVTGEGQKKVKAMLAGPDEAD